MNGVCIVRTAHTGESAVLGCWPFRKHPLDDSTSRGLGQPRVSVRRAENMAYNLNSQLFIGVEAAFFSGFYLILYLTRLFPRGFQDVSPSPNLIECL